MIRRILTTTVVTVALASPADRTDAAANVVELRLQARNYIAPATVRLIVVVEPDAANRTLRVELDGDRLFRASAMPLEGASEKRMHEFNFMALPAGRYSVMAAVLSAHDIRGIASETVAVVGSRPER